MPNIFDPINLHRLESPERYSLIPPRETLLKLGLSPGNVFVDIGAGTGFFSVPAAEITGAEGRVIAADISADMLLFLQSKAGEKDVKIDTILISPDSIPLADLTADMTFMAFVLHEIDSPELFLTEIKRVTGKNGKLVVIDWARVESPMGPPQEHRLDQKTAENIITDAGFKITTSEMLNSFHYCISAIPA